MATREPASGAAPGPEGGGDKLGSGAGDGATADISL
jgi:hypothetical protein